MANSFTPLTSKTVEKLVRGEELVVPVVLQVLGCRRVGAPLPIGDPKNRYRLMISDGEATHQFAMLASELNHMYESNQLTDFTIVKVDRYTCSVVNRNDANERRIIILFDLTVLHAGTDVGMKVGNPQTLDPKAVGNSQGNPQKENMNGNSASNRNQYQKQEERSVSMNTSSDNSSEQLTMPIESLSPYHNKWVIKARLMSKSIIRTWSNAKGEGKLFSFDLCDESGEIRATAFQAQVDKYYDMLEVDKVYYISKCTLKPANKQYSTLKNDYEMTLGNESVIQECTDVSQIPAIKYNFIQISEVGNLDAGASVDVIAVCKETSDLVNLTSKAGRDLTKREITLVDQSNTAITMTLWGEEAKNFDGLEQPVVLIKGAKIGEYGGGKTLGTASGTSIKMNPDIPEGHKLRGWFDNNGLSSDVKQLSTRTAGNLGGEWANFHESKLKNFGAGDKPDYYQLKGFIHNIRSSNAFYKACPAESCNKKVVDQENGTYRCDKCNTETSNFKYRLLVNMLVGDWTSNRWVTCFSDVAEALIGKTSQEIGELLEHDKEAADALFNDISFQQKVFKLRTKIETYQDVPKNKIIVMSIVEPTYKEFNKHLLTNIQRLTGISKASA